MTVYVLTHTYLTGQDQLVSAVSMDVIAVFSTLEAAKAYCDKHHSISKSQWEDVKYSNITRYIGDNVIYKIWDVTTSE